MKWIEVDNVYSARGKEYFYACSEVNNVWILIIRAGSIKICLDVKDLATAKKIAKLLEK